MGRKTKDEHTTNQQRNIKLQPLFTNSSVEEDQGARPAGRAGTGPAGREGGSVVVLGGATAWGRVGKFPGRDESGGQRVSTIVVGDRTCKVFSFFFPLLPSCLRNDSTVL